MMVLDASVLIAHLDEDGRHHERARGWLLELADQPLVASVFTIAEVLVSPAKAGDLDRATNALGVLGVTGVPIGDGAPARLASLRAATGLKLPDCCVLLAAEQMHGAIATFDERLADAAMGRGLAVWRR